MKLDFGDLKVNVQVVKEETNTSKHSGANLELLEVATTIRGEKENEDFSRLIKESEVNSVSSVDDNGLVLKRWNVKVKQSSYQSGIPIYDYKLELKEALEITSLALGVLEFNPYFYRESFPNDRFTIEAKVLISEEHHNILKSLCQSKDDVQVIRHGISETPLRMTIGQPYWSKQEQNFKHHLYLLGEKKEKTWESLAMAFTWMSPMRKLVSEQQVLIGELLTILEEKTVLTKEETEKLRRDSQENAWDIRFDFYQVDDIDD